MHVHFIAVAGTGMGSLAGLFKRAGHRVTGSDVAFYPPMGPALERWGIELRQGFDPAHLEPRPDLCVVGNVCRSSNPEARVAIDAGLPVASMPGALAEHVLAGTAPLVVGGTHGKTTTSALCAFVLHHVGLDPGFLIGGLPRDFDESFRLPGRSTGDAPGGGRATPFVVEGDEYDTAFFEKTPKFWHYRPEVGLLTSIEHDHIDIYPDVASYVAAFRGFVERIPPHGLLVANAADPALARVVTEAARAPTLWYALAGAERAASRADWVAVPKPSPPGSQLFEVHEGSRVLGEASIRLPGRYNVSNAVGALCAICRGYGVPFDAARDALRAFRGVRRRQELLGEPRGIRVIDDFAHHPTAIRETLAGLRAHYPDGRLWAVYEARSATACRKLHQRAYVQAFDAADRIVLAPLGRQEIPSEERLDLDLLCVELRSRGKQAKRATDIDAIVAELVAQARPPDTIALLSNGAFGGIHAKLLAALEQSS